MSVYYAYNYILLRRVEKNKFIFQLQLIFFNTLITDKRSNYAAEYKREYRSQQLATLQPKDKAEFIEKEAQCTRFLFLSCQKILKI